MQSGRAVTGISQVSSLISEVSQPPPQLQIPVEVPQASDAAITFIKDLSLEDYKYLIFEDDLITYADTGKEVGAYQVKVSSSRRDGQDCFLVEASSQGTVDGVPCGTSIAAYIAYNLETIEQHHHEYVKLENHPLDRKTEILRKDTGYQVNKEVLQGEKKEDLSKLFEFGNMEGFISEGANLLLQRVLMNRAMPAYFEVLSFDSDTNLCLCNYTELGERIQPIGDEDVQVIGLQRTIQSFTDLPTTWHTYFMTDGHLITRNQVGSPVTMKVKAIPKLIEPDDHIPKPVFGKIPLEVDADMQLHSKFLDRKDALRADYMLYLRDHPEVKAMMADFLQILLLRKPDDVVPFASQFFASFSARTVSKPAFAHSREATMSPPATTTSPAQ